MRPTSRVILLAGYCLIATSAINADDAALFTKEIAPLLEKRCVSCHNPDRRRGGLNVTTHERLLRGGDNGAVVVPGDAAKSPLLETVAGPDARMPKEGDKLTDKKIAIIRNWIDGGAAWPKGVVLVDSKKTAVADGDWWSLQPLTRPTVPRVKDKTCVRSPMDAFVLVKLEAKELQPSAAADRRTLIRRVTYDLHGLPPTPEEVDAFVNDTGVDAYENVVDRLLASPRYGERWGRFWLDVVHYGDTHGYDKDKRRDHAWPYRDYVIRSFNNDKPYARFIKEQIAGDVLYPEDADGLIATGFIAAGPWDFVGHVELREGTVDKDTTRLLDRDDMVSNTFSTFMSMTVHCARCHDHKFDPIPQKDYYRLQAVFAGVERGDRPYFAPDKRAEKANLEEDRKLLLERRQALKDRSAEMKTPDEALLKAIADNDAAMAAVEKKLQALAAVLVYAAVPIAPRPVALLKRGDVTQPGEAVTPGALSCLKNLDPNFKDGGPEGSRRRALAEWIASTDNPLTWRSIVNRVWQTHFGRGLVDTPNDFGRNGSLPTHPELLDWLAVELRDSGGSLKKLHRTILLSATYRQASVHNAAFAKIDADNRFLWRQNRVRLDAESVRDSLLAVSGKLDLKMGGPGFELFRFKDDHSPIYDHTALDKINDPATYRRTVYRFTPRSVPNPFLDCLDCADPNINTPVRNTTLTALQALALMNDPFLFKQAQYFAERVRKTSDEPEKQIDAAYRLVYGRLPDAEGRAALVAFAKKHGLAAACRVLFNANEFVFID